MVRLPSLKDHPHRNGKSQIQMASSESMDDSFRGRVEKVFGSLASTKSLAPESSMWSLTDEEVERREWRRGKDTSDREDMPCSSSFDEFLKKEKRYLRRNLRRELEEGRDDLDDDDGGDEQSDRSFRGGNNERDEWEIRSSIGLDSTLDHEVFNFILFLELSQPLFVLGCEF